MDAKARELVNIFSSPNLNASPVILSKMAPEKLNYSEV
jgi:hypothetical protein